MPRLLKVLSLNNAIHAVLKCVVLVTFLGVFGVDTSGQCNGLNVSLGSDIEVCNGTNVTLTSTYTGGPSGVTPTYSWLFASYTNGNTGPSTLIPNATSSTYTISDFSNSLDGEYTCVITFPNGCNDNSTIVVDQPNGGGGNNFDVDAGADFTIC